MSVATGSSNVTTHWHWTNDHCAEGIPLFALDPVTDEWTTDVIGFACSECWHQWWVR